jgi:hypothetical protein
MFTSENGFSSISLCLRATCKNLRANDNRLATVAGAKFWVSSQALNGSQSPGVILRMAQLPDAAGMRMNALISVSFSFAVSLSSAST